MKTKVQAMQMTPVEIVQMYKEAKEKKNQIKILADLNLCSQDEIKRILRENGVVLPGGSKPKKKVEDIPEREDTSCENAETNYSNVNDLKRIEELEAEVAELKETNKDLEDETYDYLKRLSEVESMVDILLSVNFETLESFKGVALLVRQIKNSVNGVMI